MSWRLAQSLVVLRDQIDAMFPDRDKRTDGVISGYPGAISGHNVNAAGVVCAMDITTGDYPGGITMAQSYPLADAIRNELLVAPRGLYTYIIHHMESPYVPTPGPYIAHGGPASLWQWIPYAGTDPHTSHIHISVDEDIPTGGTGSGEDPYDMTDPWNLGGISAQSGTITPIEGFLMALSDDEQRRILAAADRINGVITDPKAKVLTTNDLPAVADGVLNRPRARSGGPAGETTLGAVVSWFDANVQGLAGAIPAATVNQLQPALITVARGIGDLKGQPSAAAPVIDVPALAAQIAAALNANQAHDFLVAFRNALPAN